MTKKKKRSALRDGVRLRTRQSMRSRKPSAANCMALGISFFCVTTYNTKKHLYADIGSHRHHTIRRSTPFSRGSTFSHRTSQYPMTQSLSPVRGGPGTRRPRSLPRCAARSMGRNFTPNPSLLCSGVPAPLPSSPPSAIAIRTSPAFPTSRSPGRRASSHHYHSLQHRFCRCFVHHRCSSTSSSSPRTSSDKRAPRTPGASPPLRE